MGVIGKLTKIAVFTLVLYIVIGMLDAEGIHIFGGGFFTPLAVVNTFMFTLALSLLATYPLEKKENKK